MLILKQKRKIRNNIPEENRGYFFINNSCKKLSNLLDFLRIKEEEIKCLVLN